IVGDTTQSIDLPRIRQSTIITQMIVESGRTAVIGGLAIDRHTRTEKKIPFLGDVPILGWFFKHRSNINTKNHMLVYITPTILKSAASSIEMMQNKVDQADTVKLKKLKR
ncbi:MAG: type II secretion system protein GspD, partial [Planctomycetes bacterium]|nr:type II secretion system protein GspD [Planctomycetota bacterium]